MRRVWLEHMREWLEVLLACKSLRPLLDLKSVHIPAHASGTMASGDAAGKAEAGTAASGAASGASLLPVLGAFVSSTDGKLQGLALRCLQARSLGTAQLWGCLFLCLLLHIFVPPHGSLSSVHGSADGC